MKINHLGIAVKNLDEAVKKYTDLFGNLDIKIEVSEDKTMRIAHLHFENLNIELLESLKEGSVIGSFLEKKGEGIHHIAYLSENLEKTLEKAKEMGIQVLGSPRKGSNNMMISFLHPRDLNGVLTEFCEGEDS